MQPLLCLKPLSWLLLWTIPFAGAFSSSLASQLDNNPKPRTLRAATAKWNLRSRSLDGCLRHGINLHYLDEDAHETTSQFAARVHMSTRTQVVNLEEVEHHFSDIICSGSSIELYFDGSEVMHLAYKEFSRSREFMVVTGHEGCNNEGERGSYIVSGARMVEDDRVISLSAVRSSWKDSVDSITVDFGHSKDHLELRRHDTPVQRRDSATTTPTSAATTGLSSIVYPVPTSIPTNTIASTSIDWHQTDLVILGDIPGFGEVGIVGPAVPTGIKLSCANCSITGDLKLTSGSITMNMSDIDGPMTFYDNGYIEFVSNNFSAHIELDTSFLPTAQEIYTKKLPTIPLTPFVIPGIASIGPQLTPVFSMGVQLLTQLSFTTGFDLTVPDNSTATLVIGNLTSSSVKGFNDTVVTPLPFNTNAIGLNLTIFAGFKPQLELGMTILDGIGAIGAGVFLDIPSLKTQVFDVDKVHTNCEGPTNSTRNNTISNTIGNFTNVIPSANFDFGFQVEGALQLGEWAVTAQSIWPEAGREVALPTKCLAFDKSASTYEAATVLVTSKSTTMTSTSTTTISTATGSVTGNKPKQTGGAAGIENPFKHFVGSFRAFDVVIWELVAVSCLIVV